METRTGKCLCGEPEKVIIENGKQILERCPLYIKLQGKNPQDGAPIDHWGCAISWIPILLVENTQQARQGGAAVESMRNEIVKRMDNPFILNSPLYTKQLESKSNGDIYEVNDYTK
jgi:hypothetical protein